MEPPFRNPILGFFSVAPAPDLNGWIRQGPSAPPASPAALAFRLLASLDAYGQLLDTCVEGWPADAAMAQVVTLMDVLRVQVASLPELAPAWAALQVSHAQTWRECAAADSEAHRLDAPERHVAKLLDLESQCLELATRKRLEG